MALWLRTQVHKRSELLLAVPALLWLAIFFVMPSLMVVVVSLMTRGAGGNPELPLTLAHYERTFSAFDSVLLRSIWIAFLTTIICLLAGYPLALFIRTRQSVALRRFALFMIILPFWTNFLVRTYAWRMVLGREGIINGGLISAGIITEPIQLLNTEFAVLLGLVYGFLPFMVLPIYASIERFDFRYVEAAFDLGANKWHTFWRVMLPMTLPGVLAGCVLVFIPAIGSFVTPDLLGGTQGLMIGNLIHRQFVGNGNLPLGAALSVVMMALVLVPLLIYVRAGGER
ncbi:MAG: ABC transporter permease [Anaerolineae bacterium]|jgi:spermidine/putrescine transport system permease protein|nr:ABC transporter permease [Anaerolineae bacterium]